MADLLLLIFSQALVAGIQTAGNQSCRFKTLHMGVISVFSSSQVSGHIVSLRVPITAARVVVTPSDKLQWT